MIETDLNKVENSSKRNPIVKYAFSALAVLSACAGLYKLDNAIDGKNNLVDTSQEVESLLANSQVEELETRASLGATLTDVDLFLARGNVNNLSAELNGVLVDQGEGVSRDAFDALGLGFIAIIFGSVGLLRSKITNEFSNPLLVAGNRLGILVGTTAILSTTLASQYRGLNETNIKNDVTFDLSGQIVGNLPNLIGQLGLDVDAVLEQVRRKI